MWGRGVSLGRVAGVEIRLDATWFLIAALLTWSLAEGYFPALAPDTGPGRLLLAAVIAMLGLFGSLLLHELAHARVARREGVAVRTITLFLFGGVAEMRDAPPGAGAEFRIAVAGPLASLALSGLAYGGAAVAQAAGASGLGVAVLGYLALANLVLAVFNMLPAFPLDGGRVLRAALWQRSGDLAWATRQAAGVSTGLALALMAFGGLRIVAGAGALGFWPVLLGLFVLMAAQASRMQVEVARALRGHTVSEVMRHDVVRVHPDTKLQTLVDEVMLAHGITFVPVVEDGLLVGTIDLSAVRAIEREHWPQVRVDDILDPFAEKDTVAPEAAADALFDRMVREGRRKIVVAEAGRLCGLVTLRDLLSAVKGRHLA